MKKLLLLSLLGAASMAQAHDLWVSVPPHIAATDILKADMAYSHDFPNAEEIPADRLHIFEPLHITGASLVTGILKQQGKNYQYEAWSTLYKGSYVVTANYKPTFWSKFPDGKWAQGDLIKNPYAASCQEAQMFGKSIVIIDNVIDMSTISHPIGQTLEIIPLADPTQAKVGKLFPVQVLYEGKPLAGETVIATADSVAALDLEATHDHREPQAFSGKTDKNGRVNVLPLIDGYWKIKVSYKTEYPNQRVCQIKSLNATFTLPIGKQRAAGSSQGHKH